MTLIKGTVVPLHNQPYGSIHERETREIRFTFGDGKSHTIAMRVSSVSVFTDRHVRLEGYGYFGQKRCGIIAMLDVISAEEDLGDIELKFIP